MNVWKLVRRFLCLFAALALLLAGCGETRSDGPAPAAEAVAARAAESQEGLASLSALAYGDGTFADYMAGYYQIPSGGVLDGAILLAGGVDATELAVLRFDSRDRAAEAAEALERYRANRAGDFAGYAPEMEAMAENAVVAQAGDWAALLICPVPEAARQAFRAAISGESEARELTTPEPTPELTPELTQELTPELTKEPMPESDDPYWTGPDYDAAAILAAWQNGDPSELDDFNRAIYDRTAEVTGSLIRENMSDYEKELAIHDWIIAAAEYDPGALGHGAADVPDRNNNNPYGLLFAGKGICVGYSSTFQLFMDMIGIACITVYGTANEGGPGHEHAWNMVRLDGEWYCVDVTWDDPVASFPVSVKTAHRYFNVTSDYLRFSRHYWDENTAPEATAELWAWMG